VGLIKGKNKKGQATSLSLEFLEQLVSAQKRKLLCLQRVTKQNKKYQ